MGLPKKKVLYIFVSMKRLKNKIAINTGGASGIGKAASLRFAKEGATVIIWDIDKEKCAETLAELKSKGYESDGYVLDTTDATKTEKIAEIVASKYGQIDILINNAGITRDATFKKMTFKEWQQVIDVNLTGVFNCTKAISPYMIENNYGRIINTSSVVGLYGNFGQTNYATSKAGLIGFTKSLAKELGKYNITVNAVAPGFIETDMVKTIPDKVVEIMKSRSPLNRLWIPEDIANSYLFLASDEASYISGAVLSVDGAFS